MDAMTVLRGLMILSLLAAVSAAPGSLFRRKIHKPRLLKGICIGLLTLSIVAFAWIAAHKPELTESGDMGRAAVFAALSAFSSALGLAFVGKDGNQEKENG